MQLKPGTILQGGKYRIIKVLGQGGFGITYEAEQALIDRRVCIKEFFLKSFCDRNESTSQVTFGSSSNAEMMNLYKVKFIKEAKTIAKLNHPGIIKIYDVFTENNTAYYVMEFIEGQSLNEIVNTYGPLPPAKAIGYIKQVGNALGYAHSQHVMHLDVKPSNMMLDGDRVVLIDFGLAKQYSESGEQTSTTPVGISHGYAPLEQYQEGGVKEFSPATDVYSLGATLYKLVSGQTPPSASEVAQNGISEPPKTVSDLIRIAINKAMSVRKQDRPQDINAFLSLFRDSSDVIEFPSNDASEETVFAGFQKDSKAGRSRWPKLTKVFLLVLSIVFMLLMTWAACEYFGNKEKRIETGTITEPETKIMVHAPQSVELSKSFDVVFMIVGPRPTEFQWTPSEGLTLVKGPQKELTDSSIMYSYRLRAIRPGKVLIGSAVARIMGRDYSSEPIIVSIFSNTENGHEYVDLGLSVKWATCNIGASSPEECGDFFAWGEKAPKGSYSENNYIFALNDKDQSVFHARFSKYSLNDGITQLEPADDVARAYWGGSWRIPTYRECLELETKCTWTWKSQAGHYGYLVTSKTNGESIFLPAAGLMVLNEQLGLYSSGSYYTSSLNPQNYGEAHVLAFNSDYFSIKFSSRHRGRSIRPVSN